MYEVGPILAALAVFLARVLDVSIGTLRTMLVVQGRVALSVTLGFFEVVLWMSALTFVFSQLERYPWLLLAYAAGFATGNALGIRMEQWLAIGLVEVRILSDDWTSYATRRLFEAGWSPTVFPGQNTAGANMMICVISARKKLGKLLDLVRELDHDMAFTIIPVRQHASALQAWQPTGWRAILKRK